MRRAPNDGLQVKNMRCMNEINTHLSSDKPSHLAYYFENIPFLLFMVIHIQVQSIY